MPIPTPSCDDSRSGDPVASNHALPTVIQGGMGVGISDWRLARAVASRGQMGVVSGVALDRILIIRLQEGDAGGHLRRALSHFPISGVAQRLLERYYIPDEFARSGRYRSPPMHSEQPSRDLLELTVAASFVEIWLAKEGHAGPVGINLLEKIQAPTLPLIYGAMLAGVDYIIMGAGIPRDIPAHIDRLTRHESCVLRLHVANGADGEVVFDPALFGADRPCLRRPGFVAIVSSEVLARSLARSGGVTGLIVEGYIAGGHNALPRRGEAGERSPEYGPGDVVDSDRIAALGLPFWLAGGFGNADGLARAQAAGAVGIQVGTAFALCRESAMEPELRRHAVQAILDGQVTVRTDGRCSPTGFPFKVLDLSGTAGASDAPVAARTPCLHGYLRHAYRREDGSIGWRCPAEPLDVWAAKGGAESEATGRICLCNVLNATIGHQHGWPQQEHTLPLVTTGDDLDCVATIARTAGLDYSVDDVLRVVLSQDPSDAVPAAVPVAGADL